MKIKDLHVNYLYYNNSTMLLFLKKVNKYETVLKNYPNDMYIDVFSKRRYVFNEGCIPIEFFLPEDYLKSRISKKKLGELYTRDYSEILDSLTENQKPKTIVGFQATSNEEESKLNEKKEIIELKK